MSVDACLFTSRQNPVRVGNLVSKNAVNILRISTSWWILVRMTAIAKASLFMLVTMPQNDTLILAQVLLYQLSQHLKFSSGCLYPCVYLLTRIKTFTCRTVTFSTFFVVDRVSMWREGEITVQLWARCHLKVSTCSTSWPRECCC